MIEFISVISALIALLIAAWQIRKQNIMLKTILSMQYDSLQYVNSLAFHLRFIDEQKIMDAGAYHERMISIAKRMAKQIKDHDIYVPELTDLNGK